MKLVALLLFVLLGLLFANAPEAEAAPPPRAGWFGIAPELTGYALTFEAPKVEKAKVPVSYSQDFKYLWTGGAIKSLTVTVARSPAFKKEHAAAALRAKKPAPSQVKVGKKEGWLWDAEGAPRKLLVPLADDKALILVGHDMLSAMELTNLAGKFDLPAITAALAKPPRQGEKRSLEDFKGLKKDALMSDVYAWVGLPDRDVGKGALVLEYKLPDGSRVLVGTTDGKAMTYARHEQGGQETDLAP
jgi:hypothetical protein